MLVKFKDPDTGPEKVKAAGDKALGRTKNGVEIVQIQASEAVTARVAAYARRADVAYAEPNFIRRATALGAPNDPNYVNQWGLPTVEAPAAWSTYPGAYGLGGGASVAVVDTGVDSNHEDLRGKILTDLGANCVLLGNSVCYSTVPLDDNGHGTHVAGIVAAATNNGLGGASLDFASSVLPVKVLRSNGSGPDSAIANGIIWAAQHGAKVINLSLGGPGASTTLCDAVATAQNAYGALVVVAAGNDGVNTPEYPAACAGAIGIAATGPGDYSPDFSNYGAPDVFVSAPGVDILSTYPTTLGPAYMYLDGTSMATPFVSALAGLLFSLRADLTPAQVKALLASTTDKVGPGTGFGYTYGADPYGTCSCSWSEFYGYGRINARRALESVPRFVVPSFRIPSGAHVIATGTAGGGPHVKAFNDADGSVPASFFAFDPLFNGGARIAVGDVNGDGTVDLIAAAGRGGGPHVRVFDGASGSVLYSFFAYDPGFPGGVYVAAGDVDGDGKADIITGAGAGGGPHVKVFSGATGAVIRSFLAYAPAFSGGVFVAAGDVNGDGKADVVTGAGAGGGPHVQVFDGSTNGSNVLASFFAYDPVYTGGVRVAAGDVNGDGKADVVTAPGPGGGPHVKVFSGGSAAVLASFFAYNPSFSGGVWVGAGDVNGNGKADIITGAGAGGGPHVEAFDGQTQAVLRSFFAYDPSFTGGVFVAGN